MKVLLCHNYYQHPGGEDSEYTAQKELLTSFGHQVVEYTRGNDEILLDGFLSSARLGLRSTWADDTVREIRTILQREKPDLVHFHNTFPLVSPGSYYPCRDAGVPVIQTLQNYRLFCPAANFYRNGSSCTECVDRSLWRGIQHKCYRQSRPATAAVALMVAFHRWRRTWTEMVDTYVVPTHSVRRKVVEWGLPAEKISVKPNLVYPDPGMRATAGEYALFVGRLVPEKGVRTLLQSLRILENAVPVRIVGGGPLRSELEEQKHRDNLSSVRFEGWLPRQRVLEVIGSARFLIFPSEWLEPFGMSIVEAFACGVPVIASRLGAPAEIVEDGKTGVLFSAGNSADLACKIAWAFGHPKEMLLMGQAARAEYENKYAAEKNYQQLMKIYGQTKDLRSEASAIGIPACRQ